MKNIERNDLVNAVLVSRDKIDPDLETELLEAIVCAETDSVDDSDAAMRTIDAALTAAIDRGVGRVQDSDGEEAAEDGLNGGGENGEDGA